MIRTFEDRAAPADADKKQFLEDCRTIFATSEGIRVLARLCAAQHPLRHAPGMTDHEHGAAEVVATLWRYGAPSNSFPAIPQPTSP
jgi:hypothetical protein